MKRLVAGTALAITMATGAQAALVADVSGVTGLGFFGISFEGETNATSDLFFSALGFSNWVGLGEFGSFGDVGLTPVGGAAEINVQSGGSTTTRGIDGVFFDGVIGATDGFGISVLDPLVSFQTGDMISWSGELFLPPTSPRSTAEPARPAFREAPPLGDLTLNFAPKTAVVPLPAALPLALLGLGALGWVARRRKA